MSLRAGANIWLADAPVLENPELLEGTLLGEFPATVEADLPGLKVVAGDPPARVVGTLPGLLSAIPRDGRVEGPLPGLSSYAYGESGTVINPPEPPGVGDPGPASVDAELPSIYVVASGGEVEPEISSMFGEISALRADNMVSSRWEVGNVDEQPISGLAFYAGDVGNNAARMRGELPVPLGWASAFDDFGMLFVQLPGIEGALNTDTLRIVEGVVAQGTVVATLPIVIREMLAIQEAYGSTYFSQIDITEGLVLRALSLVPYTEAVVEALTMGDVSSLTPEWFAEVTESLETEDTWTDQVELVVAAVFGLVLNGDARASFLLSASEALEVLASNAANLNAAVTAIEALLSTDLVSVSLALVLETEESAIVEAGSSTTAELRAAVEEGLDAYFQIKVGEDIYAGWVMNTATGGFSEYRNFSFNSLARVQNRVFGASESGIYELAGDTDDGAPIDAYFKTGLMQLGTHHIKDVKAVYLGFTSDDRLVMKATVSGKTGRHEYWYELKPGTAGSMRDGRVTIGRGLRARYWQFEVTNVNGADFDIESLDIHFSPLSRRLR